MLHTDKQVIDRIIQELLGKAKQAEEDAGYSGSWGDGGARDMRELVKFYRLGWDHIVPDEWSAMYARIRHELQIEADPEFREYQRLRAKFGTIEKDEDE